MTTAAELHNSVNLLCDTKAAELNLESNATDQSIVETPEYTTTSVTGNDSPSVNPSQPSAAGQTTKKKVTVIAGDSIVKNVIGSRMGAKVLLITSL